MKKAISLIMASLMLCTAGCGKIDGVEDSPIPEEISKNEVSKSETSGPIIAEVTEAPPHISPVETVTASLGIQNTVNMTIPKKGNNTIKLSLSDYMEEGDVVSSFTFIIHSADGSDIGEYKGGCGITVDTNCSAATDEGWFQSPDFTCATTGSYGEITWNVPDDVKEHVVASGKILFGYWWGDCDSVKIDAVVCTLTRKREIPCDGTVDIKVEKSVKFDDEKNIIYVPTKDKLPEGAVPEVVTYKIKSTGKMGKFTGAFGYKSGAGNYQSKDTVMFTSEDSGSLTWFLPYEAKSLTAKDGELMLGYWWSEQPSVELEKITIKYSYQGQDYGLEGGVTPEDDYDTGFRSSAEIVRDINVGWNLGNSLDCYDTGFTGLETETGWGNPRTTKDMILAVKKAGFNAIRIPVTWGEHMDGDTIQKEWLDRVQDVVDYAYSINMYVIINMHHDDYIWFEPTKKEYEQDSERLKKIWKQIAERFKGYGDTLIFEGINEARSIGSANEWVGGTAEERAIVNKYIQDFVTAVRTTGGNNRDRSLIVTTYGANAEDIALNDLVLPRDNYLIVSVHYYAPWDFSSGQSTEFSDDDCNELRARFQVLREKFVSRGIPVIIDEFGCIAAAEGRTRAEYYRAYISEAGSQGIKCFVWDNGTSAGHDSYGIFDRDSLKWNSIILKGIMEGAGVN